MMMFNNLPYTNTLRCGLRTGGLLFVVILSQACGTMETIDDPTVAEDSLVEEQVITAPSPAVDMPAFDDVIQTRFYFGDVHIRSLADLTLVENYTHVMGDVLINMEDDTVAQWSNLRGVSGDIVISDSSTLAHFDFSNLAAVHGNLVIQRNAFLKQFMLPNLAQVANKIYFVNNPRLSHCKIKELVGQLTQDGQEIYLFEDGNEQAETCE